MGQALGIAGGGSSLDNTMRFGRLVPTEWVLLDMHIQLAQRGFGHGSVNLFAEDGTLLAVGATVMGWRVPSLPRISETLATRSETSPTSSCSPAIGPGPWN